MRQVNRICPSALVAVVVSLPFLAGPVLGAPSARPDVAWEETAKGGEAPDRALQSMIYDPVNQLYWSYGGVKGQYNSNNFQDTLLRLDATTPGAKWQAVVVSGSTPPALAFHTAVYDSKRQRMLIYGGLTNRSGFTSQEVAGGTSIFALDLRNPDSVTWGRTSAGVIPMDRFAQAAVYIPEFDAMIVSGGAQTFNTLTSSNYAVMLGARPVTAVKMANAGFNVRAGHVLVYDEAGKRLIAYGGLTAFQPYTTQSDVVWLDLSKGIEAAGDWRRMTTSSTGLKRAFMAAAFDPLRRLWWVQGGIESDTRFQRDLSVLDLSVDPPAWTRTQEVRNGPLERFSHAAAWDGPRDRAVFQGGTQDNVGTTTNTYLLNMLDAIPSATPTGQATSATATATSSATITASATATGSASPTTPGPSATPSPTNTPPDGTVAVTATPSATVAPATDTPTVTPSVETPTEISTDTPTVTPSPTRPPEQGGIYLPFAQKPRR